MADDEPITLRPRLTIFPDVHPELFEVIKNTHPSRYNAMVMNMMVRLAALERYAGQGVALGSTAPIASRSATKLPSRPAVVERKPEPISTRPQGEKTASTTPVSETPNLTLLAGALGGMLDGMD